MSFCPPNPSLEQRKQVPISEEMAEKLSPPKDNASEGGGGAVGLSGGSGGGGGESKYAKGEEGREDILRELAKACKRQGNFHLACKKYTQVQMRGRVEAWVAGFGA